MPEQLQLPSHGREPTVSEISAAGAPNYRGRAIHPQVQIENKGLMYIGSIPPNTHTKRTVSLPVKLVALGEQGHQQCTVRASDDDHHLQLVVASDPDLLRMDRRSTTSSRAPTPWLTVSAKNLSYVKVAVNRWQDGNEGSDVLIAALFKAEDRPKPLVLLLEVDTRHRDNISAVQPDKTQRRLDMGFDPNALEHIKAFFLSWQQKDYCRTEIDPTRALAVPPPGQSLSSRPPIPEGYDPHDSTTWVAPFGPVSGDQEALYLDDAARNEATTKTAGKGKSKAKGPDKVAMAAVTRVEASPGPRPEASTNASSAQSVVVGSMDDEPTVVITQSGRTVKSLRRDGFTSSIDMQSEEDHDDDDDDDAASKGARATRTTTARGKAKAKAKAQVGLTAPATAGAGPEVSSSARRNAASPTAKSVTPEETPPAAVVITQHGGRKVRTRTTVHFPSSFDMESNADDDDAEEEDAARKALVSAAATTDPRRKSKPRPNIKDKVAATASSSGAQSVGPAVETPPPPPPAAPVVITQSGRTVKTRLVHSLPSDGDDDDDDEAVDDDGETADDFSPPPPCRGSSSSSKKKKPPAKRPRVGRKRSESVVAETTGGGGGATIQSGRVDGTENGEQRGQKMEVDREEEEVMQGVEVAGAATADSGGFAADRQGQQQRQGEVAKEAGPWLDRLPFALPPLPLSTTTATGAAGYQYQPPPPPLPLQQSFDEAATLLSAFDTTSTTMTTRSSSRRPGGVPNAEAGASTALR